MSARDRCSPACWPLRARRDRLSRVDPSSLRAVRPTASTVLHGGSLIVSRVGTLHPSSGTRRRFFLAPFILVRFAHQASVALVLRPAALVIHFRAPPSMHSLAAFALAMQSSTDNLPALFTHWSCAMVRSEMQSAACGFGATIGFCASPQAATSSTHVHLIAAPSAPSRALER